MTTASFYHLTSQPLEQALPRLLSTINDRGLRAIVRGTDVERIKRLDDRLWAFDDQAFLPHGVEQGTASDALQPVLLTTGTAQSSPAEVLLLVDGARVEVSELKAFSRVCVMFDGNDTGALQDARQDWKCVTESGVKAEYWAQDEGRWVKKAEST